MIKLEVRLWIILTLIVIGTPIVLFAKRYLPVLASWIIKSWTELTKTIPKDALKRKGAGASNNAKDEIASIQSILDITDKQPKDTNEKEPIIEKDQIDQVDSDGSPEKLQIIDTQATTTKPSIQKTEIEDTNISQTTSEQSTSESDLVESDDNDLEETTISPNQVATKNEKKYQQLERIKYAALTYKERGKLDKYEKKLVEGLALDPQNDEFLNMLGNHYFQQGNEVKATSLLKRVIALHPDNHKSIWQLGQIYRQQGKVDSARLLIEKAITIKPDHPKYLISLVEMHYENKEIKDAIIVMEKLSKIRPTNVDYILTLGTLHEEVKEPTKAEKYYMKVLVLEPLNEHAKKALKRLQ